MADGQQQWRGKGGDQLLEVAASKRLLAVGPEANHAAILGEDPPPEHMSDDLALGHLIHPVRTLSNHHLQSPFAMPPSWSVSAIICCAKM
jgi:hypothetical protein